MGRRRPHNEDTLGLLPVAYQPLAADRGYLFAVADGMGGAEKGEVASRLAVEALFATYYDDSEPDLPPRRLSTLPSPPRTARCMGKG